MSSVIARGSRAKPKGGTKIKTLVFVHSFFAEQKLVKLIQFCRKIEYTNPNKNIIVVYPNVQGDVAHKCTQAEDYS